MSPKARPWIPIVAMSGATALFALYLWLRTRHLQATGQPIHWLAELWAPTAFLSIVIVTFVEKLVGPIKPQRKHGKAKGKA